MRAYTADALILRTYRYGEADRIVVFLTEDRGKKRGVAKNASKSRRRFGAALEPMTRGRATYVEHEGRELVRLDRIEPQRTPMTSATTRPPADAAHVLGHAAYFAELMDEWAPENAANDRLFRLGAAIGDRLGEPGSVDVLARYFEYWLMRLEGVYPALDRCPHCERATLDEGAVLDTRERALVCRECAHAGPTLSREAIGWLRGIGTRKPAHLAKETVSVHALDEIELVHRQLITLHLDKELRSTRVMSELRPRA
jgi:DNA repair protein RecO (recombination protein O)